MARQRASAATFVTPKHDRYEANLRLLIPVGNSPSSLVDVLVSEDHDACADGSILAKAR
jgi:hypothetical protein